MSKRSQANQCKSLSCSTLNSQTQVNSCDEQQCNKQLPNNVAAINNSTADKNQRLTFTKTKVLETLSKIEV